MFTVEANHCDPLVSIIVPLTDDGDETARRLDGARAQTWKKIEILPIPLGKVDDHLKGADAIGVGLSEAINRGVATCKGDFVSVLLPGTTYAPDKIARQVDFITQFELQEAAVFCDYTIIDNITVRTEPVILPVTDPSVVFLRLYSGLPIEVSTLLIPRKAIEEYGLLSDSGGLASLHKLLLMLSKAIPLVGMAEQLVYVTRRRKFSRNEKIYLRNLYAELLPDIVRLNESGLHDGDVYKALGNAMVARLGQGVGLAAWDILRAVLQRLAHSPYRGRDLATFAKPFVRSVFLILPGSLRNFVRRRMQSQIGSGSNRLDFSAIYRGNGFVGTESLSGAGSTRFQTRIIRRELPKLFRQLGIQSIVDIPCGDYHWMRDVDLAGIHYVGADVVDELIRNNQRLFGGAEREFQRVDLIAGPLPRADLVFCRDCLVHLPFVDALAALDTIRKSECKWLLTTTFTRSAPNAELDAAGWRPLNLTLPPFNLPPPMLLLSEKCTEAGGLAADKSLGLWRIDELRVCKQM